jgi:hypothetical protein
MTISDSLVAGNSADFLGGGVTNMGQDDIGAMTIIDSTISGNAARIGGGVAMISGNESAINDSVVSGNSAEKGGGLYAFYSTTTVENTSIIDNSAGNGGGVTLIGGLMSINHSIVSGNSAVDRGAGIYSEYFSNVTIDNSTISGNTAGNGGGVFNSTVATMEISNSTLSGNSAAHVGGGAFNYFLSELTITNSTLSGNSAGVGGGVASDGNSLTLNNSTLSGNSAAYEGGGIHLTSLFNSYGELFIQRSLVSGNSAPSGREVYVSSSAGPVAADAYNLFGFGGDAGVFGFTPGTTDVVPAEPLSAILAALADNGGPTQTHALVPGSPAIDAAPSADCAAPPINGLDQRGFPRNVDGDGVPSANECDVGSFELQPGD